MNNNPDDLRIQPFDIPETYELCVDGRLGQASASWFEDMILTVDESTMPVQTIIRGLIRDEAALYGLIGRIRDLGLTLLSVNRIENEEDE